MRIAFVAPFGLRAKGTTRARALPLAREFARRGHTVALFIPPYDSPEDSGRRWFDLPAGARTSHRGGEGVEVINIALPAVGRGSAPWHLWLGWNLFRAVRAWQPDVVHIFKPKGPSGLVGSLVWIARRKTKDESLMPAASVFRRSSLVLDCDDWEGAGGWNDDPRAGYSSVQRRFFTWQERYGLSHADAWTVTSACLQQRAIGFGAPPERVFVLHNGVTPSVSKRSVISHQPAALLYTRFAGIRPVDVAAIWALVRARVPHATLTVVGRGLNGEEGQLAGIPGIEVHGWMEPQATPALFAGMDVAMVPWSDTLPNRARHSAKVLELMDAGLPIVAYAVGELPATLGAAGVLAPPGDAAAFADAVVALMTDSERATRLGAAAQARVRAAFAWERLADVALAAYRAAGAQVE